MEFCVVRGLRGGNTYFEQIFLHKYKMVARGSGKREHDRSGAGEEGYAVICEGSERTRTRPLISPCFTVKSQAGGGMD